MMNYVELPVWSRGLFSVWAAVLVLLSCYVCFFSVWQKRRRAGLYTVVLFLVYYLLLQNCAHINLCLKYSLALRGAARVMGGCAWPALVFFACAMTAVCLASLYYLEKWSKKHITENAVKDGIDNLPSALCWYNGDGTVIIKNRLMDRLCFLVTGQYLYDGKKLEAELRGRMDENRVICLPDDTVWSVNLNTVLNGRELLYEISIYNITGEYETTRLLTKKQQEAQLANEKLTQYSREMAQMITSREILAAKVRVHDELGQGLLLTRKYLLRGGTAEDKEKLLQVLRQNSMLMENKPGEKDRTYLDMLLEAAKDMGVSMVINGELPADSAARDIIMTAVHENLTNTIRHAQGDELRVGLTDENGAVTAVFTNNGMPPKGPVEERGGLAMLRALVEAAGGDMIIEHEPKYRMTLRLKAGEGIGGEKDGTRFDM